MEKKRIKTMRSWAPPPKLIPRKTTPEKETAPEKEAAPERVRRKPKHLTLEDRLYIQEALEKEIGLLRIAKLLDRTKSVIYREITKLGPRKEYDAHKAHEHWLYIRSKPRIKETTLNVD